MVRIALYYVNRARVRLNQQEVIFVSNRFLLCTGWGTSEIR
jgi:hypothetical protein